MQYIPIVASDLELKKPSAIEYAGANRVFKVNVLGLGSPYDHELEGVYHLLTIVSLFIISVWKRVITNVFVPLLKISNESIKVALT